MRFALLTLAAIPLCLGSALACDDHVGTCEIEDWRWYTTGHYFNRGRERDLQFRLRSNPPLRRDRG